MGKLRFRKIEVTHVKDNEPLPTIKVSPEYAHEIDLTKIYLVMNNN